jgi:hypothetical protein
MGGARTYFSRGRPRELKPLNNLRGPERAADFCMSLASRLRFSAASAPDLNQTFNCTLKAWAFKRLATSRTGQAPTIWVDMRWHSCRALDL